MVRVEIRAAVLSTTV